MICLTGDVHQKSYRGTDTPYSQRSEVQLAQRYCDIASRYGVKITLFVTGKACLEEQKDIRTLSQFQNCEIGGHTFSALRSPINWIYKRICSTPMGPRFSQLRDVQRTLKAIEQETGRQAKSWRGHGYVHDRHTNALLSSCGLRVVSHEVSPEKLFPGAAGNGLTSLPINTQPDHENLLHGKYLPDRTKADRLEGRCSIQHWWEEVKEKVLSIEAQGGIATILAHPLCMEVADGMKTFETLCQFISQFKTVYVSSVEQCQRTS